MQKEYQKPQLYAESFELTEHISSPCNPMGRANHQSASSCGYDTGDGQGMAFLESAGTKCAYDPFMGLMDDNELTGVQSEDCYGGYFQDSATIFSS